MTSSTVAQTGPPAAYRRFDRIWAQPGWVLALGVYAITRLIDAVIIIAAARGQVPNMWTSPHPGYFDLGVQWDGSWYRQIALHGYPSVLPHDVNGALQQNAWGFSPAYPYLVRGVMGLTGLSFPVAGSMTSLVLGGLAIVVVYQLFVRYVDKRAAVVGIVLVTTLPCSPVLQICYTESLALLVLATALLLLVQRRYALAVPVVILLSLTRPVELPFALVVLVHLIVRWRRRAVDPFPGYEAVSIIGLGLVAFVSAWLWPAIAWHFTGIRSAYTDTMGTWRTSGHVEYFHAWWFISTYLLHTKTHAIAGLAALALVLVAAAVGPWARPLGAGAARVVSGLPGLPRRRPRAVDQRLPLRAAALPAGHDRARHQAAAAGPGQPGPGGDPDGAGAGLPRRPGHLGLLAAEVRAADRLSAVTGQRPVNSGVVFATNASVAARWSALAPVSRISCSSLASESARSWPAEKATARRIEA